MSNYTFEFVHFNCIFNYRHFAGIFTIYTAFTSHSSIAIWPVYFVCAISQLCNPRIWQKGELRSLMWLFHSSPGRHSKELRLNLIPVGRSATWKRSMSWPFHSARFAMRWCSGKRACLPAQHYRPPCRLIRPLLKYIFVHQLQTQSPYTAFTGVINLGRNIEI